MIFYPMDAKVTEEMPTYQGRLQKNLRKCPPTKGDCKKI